LGLDRLDEHSTFFTFKNDLFNYCKEIFEDFENLVYLISLALKVPLKKMRKLLFVKKNNFT